MTAQELRQKYLDFFRSKGHAIIPSASLVPTNDPTVLFTTAGMHPLVPYILGQEHPGGRRLANVQKCIRTGDIEQVGDDTHLTFFEMLGNWSLGDYFKKEAIEWSWEFLTNKEYLGLDPKRLAISCFAGDIEMEVPKDEEAAAIWRSLGVSEERIAFFGKDDNWWGPAGQTGPCGPDTEMFYWIEGSTHPPVNFAKTKDDPRWVEIWNDVFMQYNKTLLGTFEPLQQKNVDTGMGLDRTLAAIGGHRSVYDTELFNPMFNVLEEYLKDPMTNQEVRKARVIADHIRASVFIVSDAVEPSNKDRGYVLRRLLRRSMVYAHLLNLRGHWLKPLIGAVITTYDPAYPELVEKSEQIFHLIEGEEEKFKKTLEKGLKEFEKKIKAGRLTGADAFNLYQTYGFPHELTRELAQQAGQTFDQREQASYEEEFRKHQELSRTATAGRFKGGLADHTEDVVRLHTATHLLQAALRKVLGEHVSQKGSNITKERTRFDFTHDKKMTSEEIKQVEDLVNEWVRADYKVKRDMLPLEQAQRLGAIGLFGEKYADTVSVYTVFDPATGEVISREFCGGPHVAHAALVGKFTIIKEESSSAGVRRIKAVVGRGDPAERISPL